MPKQVALHTPRSLNIIVTQVCKEDNLPFTMPKPVTLHTQRSLNVIVTQLCKEGQLPLDTDAQASRMSYLMKF